MRAGDYLAQAAALPFRPLTDIVGSGPVLVVAPHPDDESLGCGGLIAEAATAGIDVHVAILTDGTGSHPGSPSYPPARLRAVREQEALAATRSLGVPADAVAFLRQPDARVPHGGAEFDAIAAEIAALARRMSAAVIVTSWVYDPHCDHEAAALLVGAACRQSGARHLAFPVWGWTLAPDHDVGSAAPRGARLDISRALQVKRRAIAAHVSQTTGLIDDSPHGFQLEPKFLALFDRPWEVFLEP